MITRFFCVHLWLGRHLLDPFHLDGIPKGLLDGQWEHPSTQALLSIGMRILSVCLDHTASDAGHASALVCLAIMNQIGGKSFFHIEYVARAAFEREHVRMS